MTAQEAIGRSNELGIMVNVQWNKDLEQYLLAIAENIDHTTVGTIYSSGDGRTCYSEYPCVGWKIWVVRLVNKEGTSY